MTFQTNFIPHGLIIMVHPLQKPSSTTSKRAVIPLLLSSFHLGTHRPKANQHLKQTRFVRWAYLFQWLPSSRYSLSIKVSQTENKMFTFYRIFGFFYLEKICLQHFQKVNVSFRPLSDWGFSGGKQNQLRGMSFAFVIGAVAIGRFRWNISLQKYDLAVLNRVEHFRSPQTVEKLVLFCIDFFNEKKKKDQSQFAAKRK